MLQRVKLQLATPLALRPAHAYSSRATVSLAQSVRMTPSASMTSELPAEDPRVSPINGDFWASDRSPCSAVLTTSSTQTPSVSYR